MSISDHIIDDWRHGWRYYSVWAYACLGALPSLYDLLAATGWFGALDDAPGALAWTVRALAVAGIVIRFVRQHRPPDDTDQAGA